METNKTTTKSKPAVTQTKEDHEQRFYQTDRAVENVFAIVSGLKAEKDSHQVSQEEISKKISEHLLWLRNQLGATFKRGGRSFQIRERDGIAYMVATKGQFGRKKGTKNKPKEQEGMTEQQLPDEINKPPKRGRPKKQLESGA